MENHADNDGNNQKQLRDWCQQFNMDAIVYRFGDIAFWKEHAFIGYNTVIITNL